MSVPGPPPNGGEHKFPKTSVDDVEGQTDNTLKEIAKEWSNLDRRWEAIKLLRLLLVRLKDPKRLNAQHVGKLDARFRDLLRTPRISQVGFHQGFTEIRNNPEHLDVDWYGDDHMNWWPQPQGFDIREAEIKNVEELLHYLELSVALQPSGTDPETWDWPPGTRRTNAENEAREWPDILNDRESGHGLAEKFPLTLEWHIAEAGQPPFDVFVDGQKFILRTRMPVRFNIDARTN